MYAFVEGEITEKSDGHVVIKPDGVGLGLSINVATRTSHELPPIGGTARLYTAFLVKEESQTLFGFGSASERDLFEALLKTSGIGGKTAIAILDLPRDRIVQAIAAGDSAVLQQVQGVGAKTAGRIVLDLKDRFAEELMLKWRGPAGEGVAGGISFEDIEGGGREFAEAVEALVGLGYNRVDARDRVRRARATLGEDTAAEDLVRRVLKHAG